MAPKVSVPERPLFKPAEVCTIVGLKPYVLRSCPAAGASDAREQKKGSEIYRDIPRRGYPFNRSNPDPQLSKGDLRVGAPGSAGVRG